MGLIDCIQDSEVGYYFGRFCERQKGDYEMGDAMFMMYWVSRAQRAFASRTELLPLHSCISVPGMVSSVDRMNWVMDCVWCAQGPLDSARARSTTHWPELLSATYGAPRCTLEFQRVWRREAFAIAAHYGNVDVLQALEVRCTCDPTAWSWCAPMHVADDRIAEVAARAGKLAELRWLQGRGAPLGPCVAVAAAEGAQLDVLKYLYVERPRIWDRRELGVALCEAAAKSGSVAVAEWLLEEERYAPCPRMCSIAASEGRLQLLRWLRDRGCSWEDGVSVYSLAARGGHEDVLEWLYQQDVVGGEVWDRDTVVRDAAWSGNFGLLRALIEDHGACMAPWSGIAEGVATHAGCLPTLEWLHRNGHYVDFEGRVLLRAAARGDLGTMAWARSVQTGTMQRAPSWTQVCERAAAHGHVEVLEAALRWSDLGLSGVMDYEGWTLGDENDNVYSHAMARGDVRMMAWALRMSPPDRLKGHAAMRRTSEDACVTAAMSGHLGMLLWLHERGYACGHETFEEAASRGDVDMMRCLHGLGVADAPQLLGVVLGALVDDVNSYRQLTWSYSYSDMHEYLLTMRWICTAGVKSGTMTQAQSDLVCETIAGLHTVLDCVAPLEALQLAAREFCRILEA